jgi:hypothetical protein
VELAQEEGIDTLELLEELEDIEKSKPL